MCTMRLPYEPEPVEVLTPAEGAIKIIELYEKTPDTVTKGAVNYKTGEDFRRYYHNLVMSFDTETTKIEDNKWRPGMVEETHFFNITFCWQVKIESFFIFGRSIEEFFEMLDNATAIMKEQHFIICWVHNLAFEYNNNADFFNRRGSDHFFKTKSQPLYLRYGAFEFRDTAQLTHKSLQSLGKDINYKKLKNDFDYNKKRGITTDLTPAEINYCFRDVEILYRYISNERDNYCKRIGEKANPCFIPFTQTGYVRHDVKKHFSKTRKGRNILKICELGKNDYKWLRRNFWGGYTHANPHYIGKEVKDFIHVDLTSAYPAVMTMKTFPYRLECTDPEEMTEDIFRHRLENNDRYATISVMKLYDINVKPRRVAYLPSAKMIDGSNVIEENGKILKASYVIMVVNDVQFKLIEQCYNVGNYEHIAIYEGEKKPLPHSVINIILNYFEGKTSLKGVKGAEYEYMLKKQLLNGIFGLCCTALEHEELMVDPEHFETIGGEMNYEPASVLPFQWALYITAYVNETIVGTINALPNPRDFIYSDTDSIFCRDTAETRAVIDEYNTGIKKKLEELSFEYFNILPKNPKGKTQYLGTFVYEEDEATAFCTIGAKRYYMKKESGLYEITMSGLRSTKITEKTIQDRALKHYKTKKPVLVNGYNTQRLINMFGTMNKAFIAIKDSEDTDPVFLPYVESIDKLSNYNVRYIFEGGLDGITYRRPCTYTLYPQGTSLTLNRTLKDLLISDHLMNEYEY